MKSLPSLPVRKSLMPAAALLLMLVAPLAPAFPSAYVANVCGNSSVCANNDGTVSVIYTGTDTVVATVTVGVDPVGVAVSPDGNQVYVVNRDNDTVSIIDTATDTVVATLPVGNSPNGVAVSPDGDRVYVANSGSDTISIIDTATDMVLATVPAGGAPTGIAVSPSGRRVYVANSGSGTVSVIDTATNALLATVPAGRDPTGIAVSPSGRRVYVTDLVIDTVSVIDTATNTLLATVSVGRGPNGIAVSPNGKRVYVASHYVMVIDATTNTVVKTMQIRGAGGIAVSPDGSRVYVTSPTQDTVSVVNAATDSLIATIPVGIGPVSVGDFVGPGFFIASNSEVSAGAGQQISASVPTLKAPTASCLFVEDTLVRDAAKGIVTLDSASGDFTYTPDSATYSGPDAFTWHGGANESRLPCSVADNPTYPVSNTATVSLTIHPLLTGLGDITIGEGGSSQEAFSLTGSTPFTHTLASDNSTVIPPAGMTVSPADCGTAGNLACMLALTVATAPGTASVTATAKDKFGDAVKKTVLVTVSASPTLSGFTNLSLTAGQSGSESLTLGGAGALSVTVTSSNTTVLPASDINGESTCRGSGSCTLNIQIPASQKGTATVMVTVTVTNSYGQSASGSFDVAVNPGTTTSGNGGGASTPLGLLVLVGFLGLARMRRHVNKE